MRRLVRNPVKHALTQDVACESLLAGRRALTAAGRALEHLYSDRLEDVYDRLAFHYGRADEHANCVRAFLRTGQEGVCVSCRAVIRAQRPASITTRSGRL
jgi:hypothetical protein